MKKFAIIHYMPLEGYPPLQNLLQVLSENEEIETYCFTTHGKHHYKTKINRSKIIRLGQSASMGAMKQLKLYLSYILFNFYGLIRLCLLQPTHILYYEAISAFPAIIYKKFFPSTRLLIHYHEYTTPTEYINSSLVNKWLHNLEIKNYHRASYISHTNQERMDRFCKDHQLKPDERFLIVPNHPPQSWATMGAVEKPIPPPIEWYMWAIRSTTKICM